MPNVIPIRARHFRIQADREVVELAYNLWLQGGFQGYSPEEYLLTAMRQVRGRASVGLFLVPSRNLVRRDGPL